MRAEHNRNLLDALTLAFWTGLRRGNILQLREGQVDVTTEPPVIRYAPGDMKNETGHIVRLCPQAKEVIWRRLSFNPDMPERRLFQDFRPSWKRVQRRLDREGKLKDFHFHDLRRSFTTFRIAAGIDPKTVQDEVGHQDSRMTMDCYGKALRDPGVRAWAMEHFRFPWDPMPISPVIPTGSKLIPA